jgi:hypothetical protein
MSKGGGTQTVTQSVDPEMKAAYLDNLKHAQGIAFGQTTYAPDQKITDEDGNVTTIKGAAIGSTPGLGPQPVAGFTDQYNQGANLATQIASGGSPGWNSLNFAANAAQNPATYRPMQVQGAQLGVGDVANNTQSLMNPFINNQIGSALQMANQNEALQHQQNAGSATAAGAFGGSRQAVQDALTSGQFALANNNMISNMLGNGYNTALNAGLNIGQTNTANQQAANLANQSAGLQGAMVNNMGAATLGNLGNQQLAQGYNAASTLQNLGLNQQNLNQQVLNAQYNVPFVQQQLVQSAMGTNANALGGTTSQPYYTNTGANMLGGAMGGAALGSALGIGSGWGAAGGALLGLL